MLNVECRMLNAKHKAREDTLEAANNADQEMSASIARIGHCSIWMIVVVVAYCLLCFLFIFWFPILLHFGRIINVHGDPLRGRRFLSRVRPLLRHIITLFH